AEEDVPGQVRLPDRGPVGIGPVNPEAGVFRRLQELGRVPYASHLDALERSGRRLRDRLGQSRRVPLREDHGSSCRRGGPQDRPEVSRVRHLVEEEDEAAALLSRERVLEAVVIALGDVRRDAVVRTAPEPLELLAPDLPYWNA